MLRFAEDRYAAAVAIHAGRVAERYPRPALASAGQPLGLGELGYRVIRQLQLLGRPT